MRSVIQDDHAPSVSGHLGPDMRQARTSQRGAGLRRSMRSSASEDLEFLGHLTRRLLRITDFDWSTFKIGIP